MFTVLGLLEFVISFLLVFFSSYFITSIWAPKDNLGNVKYGIGFLYLLLIIFAQVVLTFEVLSLFNAINEPCVLLTNGLSFIGCLIYWMKKEKPLYCPKIKKMFVQIYKGLRADKFLSIMAFGFVVFLFITILLNIYVPIMSHDALTYHLNRASYWLTQGNLNHFTIADDRNLVMPINSEILYLWVLLFFKNDIGIRFFSFFGYLAAICSVYNILAILGYSERKKLWSVLILSSFASVIAEASSLETDVLIAGLVLSSICIFMSSFRNKNNASVYFFSALAYALAIGTKTPAIIAFPGVFFLLAFLSYKKWGKNFYKPILKFIGFLILNFLIFSSYNYVLNFLDFGNFLGSESSRKIHGFKGGFKAFIANYIRYIFMMFDFSGFRYSEYVGEHINNLKFGIFNLLKIPNDLGVEMSDDNIINNTLLEVKMGTGVLGFLLFLPSAIVSCAIGLYNKASEKAYTIGAFGFMYFINIACLSFSIAYMVFSIRFITFLVVISSVVLAISYLSNKNILLKFTKCFLLFFIMSYFLVMSFNIKGKDVFSIINVLSEKQSLNTSREIIRCGLTQGYQGKMSFCYLREMIKQLPKGTSIGIFPSNTSRMYVVNMLNTEGYNIDTLLAEETDFYDLSKYDYLILTDFVSNSTVFSKKVQDKYKYKYHYVNNKLKFDEDSDVKCLYTNHDHVPLTKEMAKEDIAIFVNCQIQKKFFAKKNYIKIKEIEFSSVNAENANYMTIYKNLMK